MRLTGNFSDLMSPLDGIHHGKEKIGWGSTNLDWFLNMSLIRLYRVLLKIIADVEH